MSEPSHGDILAAVNALKDSFDQRVSELEEHVKKEWQCPYYPERGENGHSVNSRLAAVESTIDRDKAVRLFVAKVVAAAGALVGLVVGIIKGLEALKILGGS